MGDKNTKFFYACANQRKKRNKILSVEDGQSILRKDQKGVAEAFKDHFEGVFKTENPPNLLIEECLRQLDSRVTSSMNEALLKPFVREEVEIALKQMGPYKSPGPDGYNACFYQGCWNTVGENVCEAALDFLNGDNIIAAYEALHSMRTRLKGRVGCMAVKLDISKAYDRVEWPFLEAVMKKLGFGARWIELIMTCINSVSYAVLVNGSPGSVIKPTRGLSKNGRKEEWDQILKDLGARVQNNYERYLGLPIMVGRSKYNTFRGIKDRIWLKISNWKNQFLSPAGKEVLLKAVIQAILTYHMSVFALPKRLCKEIAALMSRFWWSHGQNEKKIQWWSWKKMGLAKTSGGLGFRELESFNRALLAKQCWRILTNPNSIATKVLKDKYHRKTEVLEASLGRGPSLIWRSLMGSMELLNEGLVWRVGNGQNIQIWRDKWVPKQSSYMNQSPNQFLNKEAKVAELIDEGKRGWNEDLVRKVLCEEEADLTSTNYPTGLARKIQFDRGRVRWIAPREGEVKIDWDAAFDQKEKRMGAGVIIRDVEGEVLAALSMPRSNIPSPGMAEVNALWRALQLSAELGIEHATFEGDALEIIRGVNNKDENWEWNGQKVEDIKTILANRSFWKVQHTYREGNKVADLLAKFAFSVDEEKVWIEDGPEGLYSFVIQDKIVMSEFK
ncbi:hypothetical protein F2P56_030688 [Juglans regia]|uniref:RNase H type-1 domain-containing protein n=2 Tax=Juglans regia TaxID=51240 RepID=A0A833U1Z2_JUGRE|nr:uncharacterized protein LOC109003938 [Juglans regia]KAF5450327.1 hypothetical protein F2P56_030688 [Juglans regia]